MKKLKAFTLSETMIVLVVLGIITVLVVPQLVKRQQEVQNRAKIKKAMSVYDYLVNKIVLENDIKSTNGLKTWADNDCTNSSSYFKVVKKVDNSKCKFKTSDGVYWDISHIEKPIVALKSGDLKDEIAEAPNSNKAFYFLAKFDDQGILRVSDVQYEVSKGTDDDKQAMIKLSNFVKGVKVEEGSEIGCNLTCKINQLRNTPCENPNAYGSGSCTNCTSCSVWSQMAGTYNYYDENGKLSMIQLSCGDGKGNCDGLYVYKDNATLSNCDIENEICSACFGDNCEKYIDYENSEYHEEERQKWVKTGQHWVEYNYPSGSGASGSGASGSGSSGLGSSPPAGYWEDDGYYSTYTETIFTKIIYKIN